MQQTTGFGRVVGKPRTGSPRAPPGFCLWTIEKRSGSAPGGWESGIPSRELVKYSPTGGGVLDRSKREDGMNRIDLKREIEKDIERYSSILEMYKTGKLKTGNIEGQDQLIEQSGEVARHLENIIRELQALLRDG